MVGVMKMPPLSQALQQLTAVAPPVQAVPPMQVAPHVEEEDVPPPPSPPEPHRLPAHWKKARDAEGRVYYYHMLSRYECVYRYLIHSVRISSF